MEQKISFMDKVRHRLRLWKLKLQYYEVISSSPNHTIETHYLKKHKKLEAFPYKWFEYYRSMPIEVERENGLPYVMHQGKKLFVCEVAPRDGGIEAMVGFLMGEQDKRSPHYYGQFFPEDWAHTCFIDVGSAEGLSSLELVDRASQLVLFECDPIWKEPLLKTFSAYTDQVQIIFKMVGNKDTNDTITLDEWFRGNQRREEIDHYIIKIDVEGAEMQVLQGAKTLLDCGKKVTVICCTYHNPNDEDVIGAYLRDKGFQTTTSDGYMLFDHLRLHQKMRKPYFRKGLICGMRAATIDKQ